MVLCAKCMVNFIYFKDSTDCSVDGDMDCMLLDSPDSDLQTESCHADQVCESKWSTVEQNERIISHTLTRGCAKKLEDVDLQEDERVVDESYASRSTCDYASSESSLFPGTSCLDSGLAALTALKCYEKPIKNFSGKCEPNSVQINPITETSCFDCEEMCMDGNCLNYNSCLNDPATSANSKICSTDGCSLLLRESNKTIVSTNSTRTPISTTKMVSRSCYQSGVDVSKFKSRYETAQCKQRDLCNKSHLFDYPQICLPPPTTRPITTISTTSAAPELSTAAEPLFTTMPFPSGPQFTTVGIVGITVAVCFGFVLVLIVAVAFISDDGFLWLCAACKKGSKSVEIPLQPKQEPLVYSKNPRLPPRETRPTIEMSSRMSTRRDTVSIAPSRRQSFVVRDIGGRPTLVLEDDDDNFESLNSAAEQSHDLASRNTMSNSAFISEEFIEENEEESVDQVSELPQSMFSNANRRKSSHYFSSAI